MNEEILYSEIFYSIQGEGKYTGIPTAWLRFFMCNLECNGFGQKDPTDIDTYDLPYKDFDVDSVTSVDQLPVWSKGCDSSYSWSKKFKHLQNRGTASDIADRLVSAITNEYNPEGSWTHSNSGQPIHLCFTGGEPFLPKSQKATLSILESLVTRGDYPRTLTWESNGTNLLKDEFLYGVRDLCAFNDIKMFITVSPKLFSVSGEPNSRAIKPDVISQYHSLVGQDNGQLKFVLGKDQKQWDELDRVIGQLREIGIKWPIYIMPVGATVEGQKECDGEVATMAQERGYNVSSRVHTYLWGNVIGV